MSFESMLVRLLNRRRQPNPWGRAGLYAGVAEPVIGGEREAFNLAVTPPQHTFISGRTGSGKTTLLLRLMSEHLDREVPFLFIDFHGEPVGQLLKMIGLHSKKLDVLLVEPWSERVLGWNVIETEGESAYPVVQELITIFHLRLWPDAWGPRLEELLRMTLLALAEAKLTLLEVTPFLVRPDFRRAVLGRVANPEVREFWSIRFERLSPSQRSLISEAVLNKMSSFHDPTLKYVVGQQASSLNLDAAFANGTTIIVNLSAGKLRGNNYLLASLLVAKLKAAVYRRPPRAKGYSLIIDEFQELVAAEVLDDYLRSFRKFGCSVYLATQHLQLQPEIKAAIFGNCGRFVSFAMSASDAAFLGREFGSREGDLVAGMLPDLPTGQAIAKVRGEPLRLLRVVAPIIRAAPELMESGREKCLRSGRVREEIESEISARMAGLVPRQTTRTPKTRARPTKERANASDLPEGYEKA